MATPPPGTYKIISAVDSNCLACENGGGKKKTKIIQYHWTGEDHSKFNISSEGKGFRIQSVTKDKKSGAILVIDASHEGCQLWDFNSGENQQWIAIPVNPYGGDGAVLIKNVMTKQCLRSMGHGNGVALFQEAPEDKSQWWNFVAV